MPLYGKIVVIRRGGMDGTEFPLTAACLFGREHGCDVRIQIPLVSKEHCRVEINENKEVVLTNLSSVNPTCLNGVPVPQSERLKHGDIFTILDRSFRFEAPPPPTPKKKRVSTPGKVLQQKPVHDVLSAEKEKSISASDGSKIANSMDQMAEATKEMETTKPSKDAHSPFYELYQMVKQDLDPKSPWKSAQSKHKLQKPVTPKASDQEVKGTPRKMKAALPVAPAGKEEASVAMTSKSTTKNRRSSAGQSGEKLEPAPEDVAVCLPAEKVDVEETSQQAVASATPGTLGKKRLSQSLKSPKTSESQSSAATPALQKEDHPQTPQKLSVRSFQQIVPDPQSAKKPSDTSKSPKRRSASASPKPDPAQPEVTAEAHGGSAEAPQEVKQSPRTSPRANAGQRFKVQGVLREIELSTSSDNKPQSSKKHKREGSEIPTPLPKKKRVSFGGQLSPELFDKRLPPDSPLRRGATPGRRSLGLSQTPKSLLRRATIGHIQSLKLGKPILERPKSKASPGAKKSPVAKTQSPKATKTPPRREQLDFVTPSPKQHSAKKSPVKADPQTPKGRKSPSPAKAQAKSTPQAGRSPGGKASSAKSQASKASTTPGKSPSGTTRSPRRSPSAAAQAKTLSAAPETPSSSQTPTVTGRFSISRICTPSPVAEEEPEMVKSESMTPKIPLKVSSVKAKARKTPRRSLVKAVMEMKRRNSGIFMGSWAQIVKYGQVKLQPGGEAKKVNKKVRVLKTMATKPKNSAKKQKNHTSTHHANSPATIVVGRAQRRAAEIACGAPRLVPNMALKLDMNMDEDLTGVLNLFETPAKSLVPATPVSPISVADLSLMKTPEETGEMLVSPMSVGSPAKQSSYNSEAITCLLQDVQEASFVAEETSLIAKKTFSAGQTSSQQDGASEASVTQTPKQNPKRAATCLTGVKRLMKTPRQKAEPVEDLRGKLLKTPRQPKALQEESLTGVKDMFKTPKQKATPVEDMAGIQRIMKTPKQKATPVEDMAGIQRIMKTPKQKATPVEDMAGIQRIMKTPRVKNDGPVLCAVAIRSLMETPEQKAGVQHLLKTPISVKSTEPASAEETEPDQEGVTEASRESGEVEKAPVQADMAPATSGGVKELVKMPRQQAAADVEDSEGLKELLPKPGEPEIEITEPRKDETFEIQEEMRAPECNAEVLPEASKELDISTEEGKENVCPVEDIQANDTKPKEPASAYTDAQAKRFSPLLDELLQEKVTKVSEEPVEEGPSPARGGRRRVDEPANSPLARSGRGRRLDKWLQKDEVKTLPKRGRKPKQVSPEHSEEQMSELVVAATAEPVGVTPPAAEEVKSQEAEVAEPKGETVEIEELVDASVACQPRTTRGKVPKRFQEEITSKPRRGRKAKQDSTAQSEDQVSEVVVAAMSEPEVPATATEMAESPEPPTICESPVTQKTSAATAATAKTTRGRGGRRPEASALVETIAMPTVGYEVENNTPAPGTEEQSESVAEASGESEVGTEDEIAANAKPVAGRGQKGKRAQATAAKSSRARRIKQSPAQATEVEAQAEAQADPDQTPTVAEPEENPQPGVVRSGRGRKNKQDPAPESETMPEPEPAAKSQRGRRTRKAPAQAIEVEVEAQAQADPDQTPTVAEPEENPQPRVVRSGRGRKNKQDPAPESETTPEPEPAAKSQRGRRTRKAPAQAIEVEVEAQAQADPDQTPTVAEPEENPQPRVVRSGRGRKNKQDPAPESETTPEPEPEPAAKSQRGRQTRKAPAQAVEVEAEAQADPQEPQKKKSKRGPVPFVTGSTEEASVVEVQPAPKARGAQRGRGARKTTESAQTEKETSPEDPKPVDEEPGRVAATRAVKPQPDKEVTAPAPKRGTRRKAGEEAEEPAPKKRGNVKPAMPDEPQIAEAPTATKGKRGAAKNAGEEKKRRAVQESVSTGEATKESQSRPQRKPTKKGKTQGFE